jgi:hypothetical protein
MNKYFQDELIVLRPGFIETNAIGVGFREGDIAALYQQHGEGFLNYYTAEGDVNATYHCTFNDVGYKDFSLPPVAANEMIWCANNFYLACDQTLLRISEKGAIDVLYYVEAPIQKIAVNKWNELLPVAIAFKNHVLILAAADDDDVEPYEIRGIQVVDMTFLPDDSLLLAAKKEVQVLNGTTRELQWQMETENDVIAVFPGPLRDQIGILESNGQITLHSIGDSEKEEVN